MTSRKAMAKAKILSYVHRNNKVVELFLTTTTTMLKEERKKLGYQFYPYGELFVLNTLLS